MPHASMTLVSDRDGDEPFVLVIDLDLQINNDRAFSALVLAVFWLADHREAGNIADLVS